MGEPSVFAATGVAVVAEAVPRAVILTAWWNAWERQECAADDVLDALATFGTHELVGPDLEREQLLIGLAALRERSGGHAVAVLPVPGDAAGLPGPRAVNERALVAGQAVVARGLVLIPEFDQRHTQWTLSHTNTAVTAMPVRPEESASTVRAALLAATQTLTNLDLGTNRDAVEEQLKSVKKQLRALRLPQSLPNDQRHTAHTAAQVLGIVSIALSANVNAGSTAEADQRRNALLELARTARHCLAAACSAR